MLEYLGKHLNSAWIAETTNADNLGQYYFQLIDRFGMEFQDLIVTERLFVFFDGDKIGDRLQLLLLSEDFDEAAKFSQCITGVMLKITRNLRDNSAVDVIFSGGDDLLFTVKQQIGVSELIDSIKWTFETETGNTMSCGVGKNIAHAIWNLHLAKLYGDGQTRGLEE